MRAFLTVQPIDSAGAVGGWERHGEADFTVDDANDMAHEFGCALVEAIMPEVRLFLEGRARCEGEGKQGTGQDAGRFGNAVCPDCRGIASVDDEGRIEEHTVKVIDDERPWPAFDATITIRGDDA